MKENKQKRRGGISLRWLLGVVVIACAVMVGWQLYSMGQPDVQDPAQEENVTARQTSSPTMMASERKTETVEESSETENIVASPEVRSPAKPQATIHAGKTTFLTGPVEGEPLVVALDYLKSKKSQLGLDEDEIDNVVVTDEYKSKHNGVTHIYLRQQFGGIEVANANININVTKDGSIVNMGNTFVPGLAETLNATEPKLTQLSAAKAAAAHLKLEPDQPFSIVENPGGNSREALVSASGVSLEDIPVELEYYAKSMEEVVLVWALKIYEKSSQHYWDIKVDALTGALVSKDDWVIHANYNVYAAPLLNPADGGRTIEVDPYQNSPSPASPYGWHDTDGLAGAEYTITRGNNVHAYEDSANANASQGNEPDGGAGLTFDFPIDLTQHPSNSTEAATVNLFYWNNLCHDIHYEYGFDEAGGNFQANNYGHGGQSNDFVHAESQDGGGLNNANMLTLPDGTPPRMQMYLGDKATPYRDGSLDNLVVIHEYGHGVSKRLTGGPNTTSGLSSSQGRGMGEGWSDWWSLVLTAEASDSNTQARVQGTWLFGQDPDGPGIRPHPYTTDMGINPHTYEDIGSVTVPHGVGTVWCAALWEMYWNLIDAHGFDPDLYGGTGGNNIAMQLVMDGLKLHPLDPNFLDSRDAILLADQINNGGANQLLIWQAFAKRGMGFSAEDGDSSVNVVNGFDLPDDLRVVQDRYDGFEAYGAEGGPFSLPSKLYQVRNAGITPVTWVASTSAAWLDLSSFGGVLAVGDTNDVTVSLNAIASTLAPGFYDGTIVFSNTTSGVAQSRTVELRVVTYASVPFIDGFETGTLQSCWMPSGTGNSRVRVRSYNGPNSGSYHAVLDSSSDQGFARNELTLGIDLAGQSNQVLRFWAKDFDDEAHGPPASPFIDGADFDGVAISEDGVTWYEVQGLRSEIGETYSEFVVDLDAAVATHGLTYNSTFRIRFNQYDNFTVPTDGIAFDDISVAFNRLEIFSFTASDRDVQEGGDTVTLSWEVLGATSLTLEPGNIDVTGLTSTDVTITAPTTYSLIANDGKTSVTNTVDISVLQTFLSIPLDSDPGWTTEGEWAFGVPLGNYVDPASAYSGENVYGYNLAGAYSNNMPQYWLTSSALDCSGFSNVVLRFQRWLGVESSSFDHAEIEISTDGSTWTNVWSHTGDLLHDTSWQDVTYDISAIADDQPTVYIRWGMGPSDEATVFCGWNIDDIQLQSGATGDGLFVYFTASETLVESGDTVTLSWTALHADTLTLEPGSIDVTGLTSTDVVITDDITYSLIASSGAVSMTNTVDIKTLDVLWRRDWKALGAAEINNTNMDGPATGNIDVGSQDFTVVSGPMRAWVDGSGNAGGYDLIHKDSGSGTWEAMIELTDTQYNAGEQYTLEFVIGTGSSSGRAGDWFVEFGTIDGGVFTALPGVNAGSASYQLAATLTTDENFMDDTNDSPLFGYNVGGRLQQLIVDPTDSVNGQKIAVRFGVNNSANWAGFSDMLLHSTFYEGAFTASEVVVERNDTVTLSWNFPNADSLILEPGTIDVTGLSSTNVVITSDITYSLIASEGAESVTNTVDITVLSPEIVSFAASNPAVARGDTVTLSWDVVRAASLTLEPDSIDVTGLSSSNVVISTNITYSLIASDGVESVTNTVDITVLPLEIVSFTASNPAVISGDTVTLSWDVVGEASLTLEPGNIDVIGLPSLDVVITDDITYSLIASDGVESETNTVDINVADVSVLWRRDWESLGGTAAEINNTNMDGPAAGVIEFGNQDLTVVSGLMRAAKLGGVGGYELIHLNSGYSGYEVLIEITEAQYRSDRQHTVEFVIGTASSSGTGDWFVELGTISGGVFNALSTVDSGSSSYNFAGTLNTGERLSDNTNYSDFFGYNVGGRLQSLSVDADDAVNGQNIAIRFGVTSSAVYAGFSDMALYSSAKPEFNIVLSDGSGGDLALSWATVGGKVYEVQTNADLTNPNWGVYKTVVGDGGGVTVTSSFDEVQLFYKVISE